MCHNFLNDFLRTNHEMVHYLTLKFIPLVALVYTDLNRWPEP
jgi:hypothetical protein